MKTVFPCTLILAVLLSLTAFSKPMMAPSPAEAAKLASVIVVAEYQDYREDGKTSYFHPPIARYKVKKVLKGQLPEREVSVFYSFHDGSACLEEEGWRFSPARMPRKSSEWILYLLPGTAKQKAFQTYRGDYGRRPATPVNVDGVKAKVPR